MNRELMDQIIQEVLEAIASRSDLTITDAKGGKPSLLVVGSVDKVPNAFRTKYMLSEIEDYKQHADITRYDAVLITSLTLTELSDIAQGRDGNANACAVVYALLNGMEVSMIPSALPHRHLVGKGNGKLYNLIEENVKMLEICGVKIVNETEAETVVPKNCLITECEAIELVKRGETKLVLQKSAVITPSAWDVLHANGVVVERR